MIDDLPSSLTEQLIGGFSNRANRVQVLSGLTDITKLGHLGAASTGINFCPWLVTGAAEGFFFFSVLNLGQDLHHCNKIEKS